VKACLKAVMKRASKLSDDIYIAQSLKGPRGKELEVVEVSSQAKANEMIIQGIFDEFSAFIDDDSSFLNILDDKSGKAVLHTACDEQRIEFVDFLVQQGTIDVNIKASTGNTALHYACKHNLCAAIELLVAKGAAIDEIGEQGNTSLMIACRYGNIEAVEILLKSKADVKLKNLLHESALSISIKFSYLSIADMLLAHDADLNLIFPITGNSLMMRAIFDRNHAAIDYLMNNKINLSVRNHNGHLAFHMACLYGQFELADRILEASEGRLSINDLDHAHRSVLILGCMNSNYALVDYVLERHADVDVQDIWGYSAIIFAINALASTNNSEDKHKILRRLLQAQPNLDLLDKKRCTALMYACKFALYEIAETLIRRGANQSILNQDGLSALDLIKDGNAKSALQSII
jgi:ankyrin repeat protein